MILRITQNKTYATQDGSLTAVGGLIRSIHAVIVTVTHPDTRDTAFGDGTLELGGKKSGFQNKDKTQHFLWPVKLW